MNNIIKIIAGKTISGQTEEVTNQAGTGATAAGAIGTILTSVYLIVGIIAVIFLIIGGVLYATSQGDSVKLTKAKNTIIYSIIGLIVVLAAFAITKFVLNQLG